MSLGTSEEYIAMMREEQDSALFAFREAQNRFNERREAYEQRRIAAIAAFREARELGMSAEGLATMAFEFGIHEVEEIVCKDQPKLNF